MSHPSDRAYGVLVREWGSAADCQHLAAELVARFRRERKGLASIALTTDSSVLTSVGNDYGYDHVFARQVEALCRPGDLLVGISTSENSTNVCSAISKARDIGTYTFAMTGKGGGHLATLADICLQVRRWIQLGSKRAIFSWGICSAT
jgi:D-sedoheptulose 7-phosphate isomerase